MSLGNNNKNLIKGSDKYFSIIYFGTHTHTHTHTTIGKDYIITSTTTSMLFSIFLESMLYCYVVRFGTFMFRSEWPDRPTETHGAHTKESASHLWSEIRIYICVCTNVCLGFSHSIWVILVEEESFRFYFFLVKFLKSLPFYKT